MTKDTVFRVNGIPLGITADDLKVAFSKEFGEEVTLDIKNTTICPSCYGDGTQTALVQFIPKPPEDLDCLPSGETYDLELSAGDISIDKDFYGLTPLYPTQGPIIADVIAVCGLNGHAYGSWRGKGKLQRMWLRHFLSQDIPNYRTMIYGYNSKLTSNAIHTTLDYTKGFLEELTKARKSEQSLVRAKESGEGHDHSFFLLATYATIFFGTPHRGLVVDDIRAMLGEDSPRAALLDSIKRKAELLENELGRFINYCVDIKIIDFYEMQQTRKLAKGPDGKWSRSGDYFTAVESDSSVLQLPRMIAESLPAEGDHSTMVKFTNKNTSSSYTSVLKHLRNLSAHSEATVQTDDLHLTAYAAVLARDTNALKRILRARPAIVNERQKGNKTTLLHLAIENGDEAIISTLLEHQANIDSVDEKLNTPWHLAAHRGHEWAVGMLLRNGADAAAVCEGMMALHIAALGGHENVVKVLLDHKVDVESIVEDENGFTVLHLAARSGHLTLVKSLLNRQANIEARGKDEDTPLHCAAWGGQEKVIELLVDHGADIKAVGVDGSTALHFAACHGHVAAMEMLMSRGVDIEATNNDWHTALHVAASGGYDKAVEALLAHGAMIRAVDKDKNTALHFATQNGHDRVVNILLQDGKILEEVDNNGYTPLHSAAWCGHRNVLEVLLRYGANLEATENFRYTALHLAAMGGHGDVVEELIKRGANVSAVDRNGNKAMHIAAQGIDPKVIALLRNDKDGNGLKSTKKDVSGGWRERYLEASLIIEYLFLID